MTSQPQTMTLPAPRTTRGLAVDQVARDLLDHAEVLAWVKDADDRFVYLNQRYAGLLGRSLADCVGRRIEELLPRIQSGTGDGSTEEVGPRSRASHRRVLLEGKPMRVSETLELGTSSVQLHGFVFPVEGSDGSRLIGGAFTDGTDAEVLRRKYAETIELHQDLFAHAGVAMAVLDRNGMIVQANHECQAVTERSSDELVGTPFWSVARVDHAPGMRAALNDLKCGLNRLSTEVVLQRSNGPSLRCRVTVSQLPSRPGGRVGALMSITSLRRERTDIGQQLRPIERDILCQVAAGATTAKIAAATHLSRQGVDYNLRTLMERFDAGNRAELVARAYALGVLAPTWPPRLTGAQTTPTP